MGSDLQHTLMLDFDHGLPSVQQFKFSTKVQQFLSGQSKEAQRYLRLDGRGQPLG